MTIKLIKLRLLSAFSGMAKSVSKKNSDAKNTRVLMLALYAFIAVMFSAIFALLAVGMAPTLIALCADWFYFLLFIGISVSLVFVLGIFETKSEIFECKDNELLLSMPIKPISIVLSRVFSVIIWNYIETAIIFVPAIIVYAVFGGMLKGIIGGILVFLFLPLLPTALSCFVGYLVSLLSKRFKNKTFITVIFFLGFFGAYMFGYTRLMNGMDSMLMNIGGAAESVGRFKFLLAVGEAALLSPVPLLLIILTSLFSAVIAVLVIARGFEKIAFAKGGEKKAAYRAKRMQKSSLVFLLVKKELSRFFSSATYIINSSLGLIFMVLLSGYALIKIDELLPIADMFSGFFGVDSSELVSVVLVSALSLCSSFSYISSCSLSLEGRSLWIMKSMPVPARDALAAKTLFHLVITAPPTLVSSVLLLIATGEWGLFWYYILIPQILGVICALIGVLWNVAFPKFEFANETAVIKNSASVFLTMLSVMLLSTAILVMGVWLLMRIPFVAVILLEFAALGVLIAALVFILLKFATLKYESL